MIETKKDKRFEMKMSKDLFQILTEKAKQTNLTKSELLRQSISSVTIKESSKDYPKILGNFNRIGNNINQIAHQLNSANLSNNLGEFDFNNLLNKLVIIEANLNTILSENKE